MQKTVNTCFRVWGEILKSSVAFVAIVSICLKSLIARNVGVIFEDILATIIFLIKIKLLPLLSALEFTLHHSNKLFKSSNKHKVHCCQTFMIICTIAANGQRKQHWQQKHTFFELLWGGVSFSENRVGGELGEMGVNL